MILWGIVDQNHDASLAVYKDGEIVFAGMSERYSRIKHDKNLHDTLINDALKFGTPDKVILFEDPFLKKTRLVYQDFKNLFNCEYKTPSLDNYNLNIEIYGNHHESHAAAGFYTSGFKNAAIIVADSIGEWDTLSIWEGRDDQLQKIWSISYPHSLGLFYSAITQKCGFKPNSEEYIVMGLSSYGEPEYVDLINKDLISVNGINFKQKWNLHKGLRHWNPTDFNVTNLAASAQYILEEYMVNLCNWAMRKSRSKNLIVMGGIALNCKCNEKLYNISNKFWTMPNAGDGGSAIGAILAYTQEHIKYPGPYLGYDIKRIVDIESIIQDLINGNIVGLANGKAEFSPRALGNRCILARPDIDLMQSKVNDIKQREHFRPFAPVVLEEHAKKWFDISYSPYMNLTTRCKYPEKVSAVVHVDNTSRIQTINKLQNKILYEIVKGFYELTGIPMLLLTSLNVKGEPMVNDEKDVIHFTKTHNIKVY